MLCVVTFRVQIVDILHKLLRFDIFTSIFVKILCIGNIILGLYRVTCECGHSQVPKLKLHKEKREQDQQPLQSALPPKDEYLVGTQTRQTLVIEDYSSLLTPLTIDKPEWKETLQTKKQLESTTDTILEGETLVSQVTPLLGTTPSENTQIQHRNIIIIIIYFPVSTKYKTSHFAIQWVDLSNTYWTVNSEPIGCSLMSELALQVHIHYQSTIF